MPRYFRGGQDTELFVVGRLLSADDLGENRPFREPRKAG